MHNVISTEIAWLAVVLFWSHFKYMSFMRPS